MFMNPYEINEPEHVYQIISEIIGKVVVRSNTKAVVVIVSSAYQLIISA